MSRSEIYFKRTGSARMARLSRHDNTTDPDWTRTLELVKWQMCTHGPSIRWQVMANIQSTHVSELEGYYDVVY